VDLEYGGTYLSNLRFIDLNPMVVEIHQGNSKRNEEGDYLTADYDQREVIQNDWSNGRGFEW
jgi:hypothetical protein